MTLRRTLTPLLADGNELAQVRAQLVRLAKDFLNAQTTSPFRSEPVTSCELVIDPHTWDYLHCNLAEGSLDLSQWDLLVCTAMPLGVGLVLDEP